MNRKYISGALALAAVLGCALGATAQVAGVSVVPPGGLVDAINQAKERDVLVLSDEAPYDVGAISIIKDLTLRAKDGFLGHKVTVNGKLTIETGKTLTLDGIGVTNSSPDGQPPTSDTAIMVMNGGKLVMNRCYITGSDPGIDLSGSADAIITSSVFTENSVGIRVAAPASLSVIQCSFIENTDKAVDFVGGVAKLFANLFQGNGNAVSSVTPTTAVTLRGNVLALGDPIGSFTNVAQVGGIPEVNVVFSTDTNAWKGKLQTPIQSGLSTTEVESLGVEFPSIDFEEQGRATSGIVQAGADEVGGDAGLVWLECVLDTPFVAAGGLPAVGLNRGVRIYARLGPGAPAGDRQLWIIPETGTFATGKFIPLDASTVPGADRSLYANFTAPATVINDLLLDGKATIYVVINGVPYGRGRSENLVAPIALANSDFVIDTIPPNLVTGGAVTAPYFISNVNDPDAVPFSNGTIGGAGGSVLDAQAFFNTQDPLGLTVVATFSDDPPANVTVLTAGLAPVGGGSSFTGKVSDIIGSANLPPGVPFWDAGFEGYDEYLPANFDVTVNYSGGGGTQLRAFWTFLDIPLPLASNNDWRIGPRFNAIDLAGNVATSNDRDPVYFWWMLNAVARLTSFPYAGATALEPVFAWDLVRYGDSPGRSEPAMPQAYYRLWATNNVDDPLSGTWVAITGWEGPSPDPNITINPTLLASDSVYMIAVRGIDEAGNDQLDNPAPGVNPVNFDDANIDGGLMAAAMAQYNMPFVDFWRTPVTGQGQVETAVIPQFWHNVDNDDQIDEGEVRFGASRSIPYPASGARVAAAFLIQVQSASGVTGITWEVYRDGQLILESDPNQSPLLWPPSGATLVLPADLIGENMVVGVAPGDFVFGDPQRTQEFVLRVTGYDAFSTPIADPTPVTVQFRVVPEAELEKESGGIQPFKTFTRE